MFIDSTIIRSLGGDAESCTLLIDDAALHGGGSPLMHLNPVIVGGVGVAVGTGLRFGKGAGLGTVQGDKP